MQTFYEGKGGIRVPALGFGTWQLPGNEVREPLTLALQSGFRHIDTAERYENEVVIGEVLAESRIPREEVFVTSKVWRDNLRRSDTLSACKRSLARLSLDYLDLYLIHWPNKDIPLEETLGALEELKEDGYIRAYGVSNFVEHHLQELEKYGFSIFTNQIEYHPAFQQKELAEFLKKQNILLTAYSPLGQGESLSLSELKALAKKYNKTPAQVILNWHIYERRIAIPRATSLEHITQNIEALSFEMEKEEYALFGDIPQQDRINDKPYAEF